MPVTVKEIAAQAGVSIGTVSLALKDSPRISNETREKVKNIADKLGYIPNNLGKALQSGKSGLIGYLISNVSRSFYNDLVQGIGNVATVNNYGLLLAVTGDSYESEMQQLKLFEEKSVEGIIVSNYSKEIIPYLVKLRSRGIPLVVCDFEPFDDKVPTVVIDDEKAAELLVNHLVQLGHTSFAYCFHVNENSSNRFNACKRAAEKHGIENMNLCESKRDLIKLLDSKNPPTAAICYSDYHAVEVKHMLQGMGFDVPKDISITGFDDMEFASWPEFGLTTISQPKTDMGKTAAEILFHMLEDKVEHEGVKITPQIIIRSSTDKACS